jgi:hypothetical protein
VSRGSLLLLLVVGVKDGGEGGGARIEDEVLWCVKK